MPRNGVRGREVSPISAEGPIRDPSTVQRVVIGIAVVAGIAVVGWLDNVTGLVPDVTVLYLLPIAAATYEFGLAPGILVALVATTVDIVTHPGGGEFSTASIVADALTHLGVFVLAAIVASRLFDQLRRITRLEARRGRDLAVARDVHASYLEPPDTERKDVALGSRMGFAFELGGDYLRSDDTDCGLFLAIGDISGKGTTAALFTVALHEQIDEALSRDCDPGDIVRSLNERLYSITPPNMFVTLFCAVLDDRSLTYVNAGHEPPLLLLPDATEPTPLTSEGALPVAVDETFTAVSGRVAFPPGSVLLAVTDGVTESPRLEPDPRRRLARLFTQERDGSPQRIADAVFDAATSPDSSPRDDVTVLCVARTRGG